jgi:hypothetical protein
MGVARVGVARADAVWVAAAAVDALVDVAVAVAVCLIQLRASM